MAYNDSYMLACHCAAYSKESTSYKSRVFLLLRHIRHKLYITYCKETWIVQQGTVDTTTVWSLDMYIFISAGLKCWLCCKVVKNLRVFYLSKTNSRTSNARQLVCAKVGKCLCHIAQLVTVFQTIPLVRTARKEVVVALAFIVASIK